MKGLEKPRKLNVDHKRSLNQDYLSLTSLKNVPLDTPIIGAASVFVIS